MKNINYTFMATILSVIYWLIDSVIHKFIYLEGEFEFIPSEINELWMRIVIVVLLICFGIYANHHTKAILKKEKEKRVIYKTTMQSTQYILNDLLNQMQYFKMIVDDSNVFDNKTNELYEKMIKEEKELLYELSSVEELTEESIIASVYPKSKK